MNKGLLPCAARWDHWLVVEVLLHPMIQAFSTRC